MFTRFALPLTVSALALSGCLTTQENPNYQHSTRYQGANPQGDVMPQAIQNARVETIQMPVSQTQTTAVVYEQAPAPIVTSTDSTYTVETVTGTPGYMAMQSGQATVVLSDANGVSTRFIVSRVSAACHWLILRRSTALVRILRSGWGRSFSCLRHDAKP